MTKKNPEKDPDPVVTWGAAIVIPVCFIGSIAAVATAGQEAWWGWLFLGGLGVWCLVVLPSRRGR
jgi:hypothetical protein